MRDLNYAGQEQMEQSDMGELDEKNGVVLNFDIQSYQFHDLDLEMAVKELPQRDQTILVLHLMGHSQNAIAKTFSLSRSMMSKRFTAAMGILKDRLNQDVI
ncbi:hypothetical protein ACFL6S_22530 [Candidatus Poribacteria bacterium]